MLHKLLKQIVDITLGNRFIKKIFLLILGYRWNGWMLWLFSYRPIHMVGQGENCVLAGVYNSDMIIGFSNVIGEIGCVVVIEANPENAERLKKETSHLSNVIVINRAVWNTKGEMDFICSLAEKDQGYNRLDSTELQEFPLHLDANPEKVKVQTDTIFNILNDLGLRKVDHINLTINGAELQALTSLLEIRKNNPDVRVYINSETPEPALKVIDKLNEQKFNVYTSHLIRVVNKRIKLVRIYACN